MALWSNLSRKNELDRKVERSSLAANFFFFFERERKIASGRKKNRTNLETKKKIEGAPAK